ncbi:MAG: prepilin-type N-terminal cleavage/methylation domain-containing protein [Archangium sp.]|nr:prepilin-type N-terminal cleavage/methylation domain-containing protein [Archangium sp.]
MSSSKSTRGMTILEVMMAMVVLAIALTASLAAMQQGNVELRLGQTRQQKLMLAQAVLERERLIDKDVFFTPATAYPAQPTSDLSALAVSVAPWVVDPVAASADPNDLSTGAYFNITADGLITRATGIAANTPCNAVPVGTICRETFTHLGLPYNSNAGYVAFNGPSGTLPAGSRVATTWVRVSRRPGATIPPEVDVTVNQVNVQ